MTAKPKKYYCPVCNEYYNTPKKHCITKMKICPNVGCGYIAGNNKNYNLSLKI